MTLRVNDVTNPDAAVVIVKPDGTLQAGASIAINNNSSGQVFFMDTQTLAAVGTYQLWVQHHGTNIGSETLQLNSVPPDFTGSLTVPAPGTTGPATTVTITAAGQNANLTFAGTAGQKLSFNMNNSNIGSGAADCLLHVFDPNNTDVTTGGPARCGPGASNYVDTITLATTGTYTVFIDPQGMATGSIAVSINNAADFTGSITIGGPSVQVPSTGSLVPGQNAYLTFSGTQGLPITVQFSNNTVSWVSVTLLDAGNNTVTSNSSTASSFNMQSSSLPSTGAYTIKIHPQPPNTGSMTVTVTTP